MNSAVKRSKFEMKLLSKIENGEKILSCYLMLGYPDLKTSKELIIKISEYADIIEIGIEVIKFGTASITLYVEVRNMMTKNTILTIEKIIMVNLDSTGNPTPHGKTKIEFTKDRLD
jgi:hypothetical protein